MIALLLAAAALAGPPGKACAPIAVYVPGSGTYGYEIRVEGGGATCAEARNELRRYIAAKTSSANWTCFRGHSGDIWAAACARGNTIVRAYGPKKVTDPWTVAAARLAMPVLAPAAAAVKGLALKQVKPEKLSSCGETKEQLTALYRGGGKEVYVVEGKPRVCGDIGEATQVGRPKVHGKTAGLFDVGGGSFLLIWSERGIQIGVQTHGSTRTQLLAIAQSFHLVVD